MHIFHIHYRNTQGTLMRILTAIARRGIEMPFVQAEPVDQAHKVTLIVDVNTKQVGQLCRDWRAIVDVVEVRAGAPIKELWEYAHVGMPHRPESVTSLENARTATA